MLVLDPTDVLEGIASVADKIHFTFSGVDGLSIVSSEGLLSDSQTEIYTAIAATRLLSLILVNTHSAAVTVNLHKDPTNAGTLYDLLSHDLSLASGYSLYFDGQRCLVLDTSGQPRNGFASPLGPTDGGTGLVSYTKGDILYASASNVLSALGIGAANYKLFSNPAGDLPAWAPGIKIGTLSIDTAIESTSKAYTGIGFKPSAIIFIAGIHATTKLSIGFDDASSHLCYFDRHSYDADTIGINNTYSIRISGGGDDYSGAVATFDADGFTIAWVKVGNPTGTLTFFYLALR